MPTNPCLPSPCGPFSQCREVGGSPSCSCLQQYMGSPPNCRPECTINTDCASDKACINERCVDPCRGSCGLNADCRVQAHLAICACFDGYTGDPFNSCTLKQQIGRKKHFFLISAIKRLKIYIIPLIYESFTETSPLDLCHPSPCGSNAVCNIGVCTCLPEYTGDPYFSCRPECTTSSDCSLDKTCVSNHCVNPCINTCGVNANCDVVNHMAVCTCPSKTTGNAFIECKPMKGMLYSRFDN